MPVTVRKTKDGKHQVVDMKGKVFGTHNSRQKAIRQVAAIEASKRKRKR